MSENRVLITGASGLLGRAVYKEFKADSKWTTLGLARSRASGELQKVDLTDPASVHTVFSIFKPSVVIHCAAERRPDVVENDPEKTKAINCDATKTVCEEAAHVGAYVMFISTDYVFDGKNPPHTIHHKTNPLNKYGESKLAGEGITLAASSDNIVLRVPLLYGEVEKLDESAVTILFAKVKVTGQSCVMSDYERRFPTHCADVARVLCDLCEKRLQEASLTGIFQWSGNENVTKYDIAVVMASVFNLPTDHIIADKAASGGALRPYNAQLDPSRIQELGINHQTLFTEGIKACLQSYL